MSHLVNIKNWIADKLDVILAPHGIEVLRRPTLLSSKVNFAYVAPVRVSQEEFDNTQKVLVYSFDVFLNVTTEGDKQVAEDDFLALVEAVMDFFRRSPNWIDAVSGDQGVQKIFVRRADAQMQYLREGGMRQAVISFDVMRFV